MIQDKRSQIRIMVIGVTGVGKSWLVNRLTRYIERGEDLTDFEMNEKNQAFTELCYGEANLTPAQAERLKLPLTVVYAPTRQITFIEGVGLDLIKEISMADQVYRLGAYVESVDYFIYVGRYDHKMSQQDSLMLKMVGQVCTMEKLIVFVGKKSALDNDPLQQNTIHHQYNQFRNQYFTRLFDDIQPLANEIIYKLHSQRVILYAVGIPSLVKELMDRGYDVFEEDGQKSKDIEFDVFIVHSTQFKPPTINPFDSYDPYDPQTLDMQKCIVYFDSTTGEAITKPYQQINAMSCCSDEMIQRVALNPGKIYLSQCRNYVLGISNK